MTDSQGTLILPGDKLKSSVFENCKPAIDLIEENKYYGIFKSLINPFEKPFKLTQKNINDRKWIIHKDNK